MSCLALTAAPFEDNQNESGKGSILEKTKARRSLLSSQNSIPGKQVLAPSAGVQNVMNAIASNAAQSQVTMNNDGASLAEFQPLPATAASCAQQPRPHAAPIQGVGGRGIDSAARVVGGREGFNNTKAGDNANVFQQMLPLYTEAVAGAGAAGTGQQPPNELVGKLNRIINMLEDQEDVRTGHVGEELVLYGFLGVFVIFIVDSFARAGKYVR